MIEPGFFSITKDFRNISNGDILVFGQLPDLTKRLCFAPSPKVEKLG